MLLNRIHVEPQQSLKSWNVEFDSKNGRTLSPSWCCGSANQNTQLHNIISHSIVTPQTISHFTAPPIRLYQMLANAKNWQKGPPLMNGRQQELADTNQCSRRVSYNMAKPIQISRVTSANMTHLTKISVVNHKQLSNYIDKIHIASRTYIHVLSLCHLYPLPVT
jgi:hypothetical protein